MRSADARGLPPRRAARDAGRQRPVRASLVCRSLREANLATLFLDRAPPRETVETAHGAPRSVKMCTITSPWRYDVTGRSAQLSAGQRRRRTGHRALVVLQAHTKEDCEVS